MEVRELSADYVITTAPQVPKGYKQTEAGVIPADWEVKSLDSTAFVTSGKRLPLGRALTDHETPHPYIRVTDMRPGTVALSDIKFVPVDAFPAIKQYRIFKNDIFISVAGTLGIVGKIPSELDGANLTENADRITNITCSQDYLLYILMSPLIQNVIDSLQTVGAQPKLALSRIRKFNIPLPPTKTEQEAIAVALSDADALIESLEQLLSKKRQIKQGAMQELLTGERHLPGFSGEWVVKRLGDVVEINKGELITEKNAVPGPIPVIAGGKRPAYSHNRANRKGKTITVSGSGASAGYVAYYDIPIFASDCSTIGEGTSYAVEFIYFVLLLNQCAIYKTQTGGAQPHIHPNDLRPLTISVPATKEEQTAIAAVLSDMDAEIAALEEKLAKARAIKQGMMQELLTGRIRLV
ncbi:restriction endonuclease subunit S [Thermithiobacillus plumbiphilus]|uniref:Restriction endonuclease subunit S n=1 Tax=Thermithiobacillus plumbiphilus TaxID=1729899 RepID=A0ABU9D494_9PROT